MSAASLPLSLLSLAIIVFVFLTRRALSESHVFRGDTLEGFVLALLTGAWPMAIVTTLTTWMTGGAFVNVLLNTGVIGAAFVLFVLTAAMGDRAPAHSAKVKVPLAA